MKKQRIEIAASEHEILRMTEDLDQLHNDVGMPAMRSGLADLRESLHSGVTGRRTFLIGTGGVLAGAGVFAAMASTPGLAAAAAGKSSAAASAAGSTSKLTGTLAVAGLAAGLENLAVYAYGAALSAASAGKLGTVPPAIGAFATTAKEQHSQHAAAWNSILTGAGKKAVTGTDPTLTPTVNQKFGQVTNVVQLGQLALLLENIAAQTYQVAVTKLKAQKAIEIAASIQPVEMQHVAILYYVLGEYPGAQSTSGTPLAFSQTTMAA